jgi:hypothetical protein
LTKIFAIYFWTLWYCHLYGVDPAFALAVAHVESRAPGQEFRTGLLGGRWYGPFNVEKSYKAKWGDIDTIRGNTMAGVRALRGRGITEILRRYNSTCTGEYIQAVREATKKYHRRLKG